MDGYVKKVGKTLLMGLIIAVIALVVYMVYPKYQIQSVRVDDNTVVVTRINTITGQVSTSYKSRNKLTFLNKYR